MPTAGEARLKQKPANKSSKDGISVKARSSSTKSRVDAKRKVGSHPPFTKSSIPVPAKKGKENEDPNAAPARKNTKKTAKPKKAPDFLRLHTKWEYQLAKGKAVSKKKNTTVEAFRLTENSRPSHNVKRSYAYNSEDEGDAVSDEDDDFKIDSTALKSILNETGIKDEHLGIAGRATFDAVSSSGSNMPGQSCAAGGIFKRDSIYYTGPRTNHCATGRPHPVTTAAPPNTQTAVSPLNTLNVDSSKCPSGSSVKKQVAWADQAPESDEVDFQPDFKALQSILSNTGINDNQLRLQNTGRGTLAGGRLTPHRKSRHVQREEPTKRTSIYYTGPRHTRPSPRTTGIQRTSVIQSSQITEIPVKKTRADYNPFATVVGRQGTQVQDEDDPIASLATMHLPKRAMPLESQSLNATPPLTPARKLELSSQFSSVRKQPRWADIFAPQRSTNLQQPVPYPSRSLTSFASFQTPVRMHLSVASQMCTPEREIENNQTSQREAPATLNFKKGFSTPLLDLNSPLPMRSASQHTPLSGCIVTQFPENARKDRANRLQCSAVQVTSFQPPAETEVALSMAEATQPHRRPDLHSEHCKSVSEKEEMIARLEQQALEDLGLLHIAEMTDEKSLCLDSLCPDGTENSACALPLESSNRCESNGQTCVADRKEMVSKPLASHCSKMTAVTPEQQSCLYNVNSNCHEQLSSFFPYMRFANPTPIRKSRSTASVSSSLHGELSVVGQNNKSRGRNLSSTLSLRSAFSPSIPHGQTLRNSAFDTARSKRFRWEPTSVQDSSRLPTAVTSALAREALLDLEVSSYMLAGRGGMPTPIDCRERPLNPIACSFLDGDSVHFVPIRS